MDMVSGTRDNPRITLAGITFSLFLCKMQPAVYFTIAKRYRGAKQLGWASWVASAGRVTASATPFVQRNALASLLTRTTLGVASVRYCLGFKAEIRTKEVKINPSKATVIELPRKTQEKGIFAH